MTEEHKRKIRLMSQVMSMVPYNYYNDALDQIQNMELSDCAQENLKKVLKKVKIKQLNLRSVR